MNREKFRGQDLTWSYEGKLFTAPAPLEKKSGFVTGYFVADEDFDVMRSVRKTQGVLFPIFMPPLYDLPLELRFRGKSASDFLKIFRLEQYEGLIKYGEVFVDHLNGIFAKITTDDSADFTLEGRARDVLHAFDSAFLKTVLQEIQIAIQEEISLKTEKRLIELRLELENLIKNQKTALEKLLEVYNSPLGKITLALYDEVLGNPSWTKLALYTDVLETASHSDSWVTFPEARRFLAPFILKSAFRSIGSRLDDADLQKAFYEHARFFSKPGSEIVHKENAVFDESLLLILPKELVIMDADHRLTITKETYRTLKF